MRSDPVSTQSLDPFRTTSREYGNWFSRSRSFHGHEPVRRLGNLPSTRLVTPSIASDMVPFGPQRNAQQLTKYQDIINRIPGAYVGNNGGDKTPSRFPVPPTDEARDTDHHRRRFSYKLPEYNNETKSYLPNAYQAPKTDVGADRSLTSTSLTAMPGYMTRSHSFHTETSRKDDGNRPSMYWLYGSKGGPSKRIYSAGIDVPDSVQRLTPDRAKWSPTDWNNEPHFRNLNSGFPLENNVSGIALDEKVPLIISSENAISSKPILKRNTDKQSLPFIDFKSSRPSTDKKVTFDTNQQIEFD